MPDAGGAPQSARSGALVLAGSRVAVAAAGALTMIVAARVLGPGRFGTYAIAQTTLGLLMVLTSLGTEHGITFLVSAGRWRARAAFTAAQRLAFVVGSAGAAVTIGFRLLVPAPFHRLSIGLTAVAAAGLPFALSWFYGSYVALAEGRYRTFALPPAVQAVANLCLVAILSPALGLPGAVIALACGNVLAAVGGGYAARRHHGRGRATECDPPGLLRAAVGFGARAYAANALQTVNYQLDMFILNALGSAAVVGHYALAVSLTSALGLLPQALSDVLFPRVATLSQASGKDRSQALARAEAKSFRHVTLLTAGTTVAMALVLIALVVPVYGRGFTQTTVLGLLLLPGAALLAIASPVASAMVGRGHPELMLRATLMVTPPTVLAYAILIPTLHATGAALASTFSYAAVVGLSLMYYRRLSGLSLVRQMWPTRAEISDYSRLVARRRGAGPPSAG